MESTAEPARRAPSAHARVVVLSAVSLVVAVLLAARGPWPADRWWLLPVMAFVVAVGERVLLTLDVGDQRHSFSATDAVVAAAMVTAPCAWLVAGVAAGVAVAQMSRRMPAVKVWFNTSVWALSTAAAVRVTGTDVLDEMSRAVLAMAVFWVLDFGLVTLVVGWTSRQPVWRILRGTGPWAVVHATGIIGTGLLSGYLLLHAPVGLLGVFMPLLLVWTSYDQQSRRTAEAALFSEVFRVQRDRLGASPDLAAQVLVGVAAERLQAVRAELVVFTSTEGPVHYRTVADGLVRRDRVDLATLDAPWLVSALAAPGTFGGSRAGRPWCTSTFGDPDSPTAVLALWRGPGGGRFSSRDLGLADLLVRQAATWLEPVSSGLPQGPGSEAMRDLRDAAGRLALLSAAEVGTDVLQDVVDEVHVLETAVARLAAAAATSATTAIAGSARTTSAWAPGREPVEGDDDWDGVDRRMAPPPEQVPDTGRRATDWTTTGVLQRGGPTVLPGALPFAAGSAAPAVAGGIPAQPGLAAQPGLPGQPGLPAQPGASDQPGAQTPVRPGGVG